MTVVAPCMVAARLTKLPDTLTLEECVLGADGGGEKAALVPHRVSEHPQTDQGHQAPVMRAAS